MANYAPEQVQAMMRTLSSVERFCSAWEQSETWDGRPDIVGRAFGAELRKVLAGAAALGVGEPPP